jgi:hypothetical protein
MDAPSKWWFQKGPGKDWTSWVVQKYDFFSNILDSLALFK